MPGHSFPDLPVFSHWVVLAKQVLNEDPAQAPIRIRYTASRYMASLEGARVGTAA